LVKKKKFHRFGFSSVWFLKLFCFEIMTELSFYLTACQTGRYKKIFPLVQLGSDYYKVELNRKIGWFRLTAWP